MEAHDRLRAFAERLATLLAARDARGFETVWERERLSDIGWEALARARRAGSASLEPVLLALDRRLLAALERGRALPDPHLVTFRLPELERWQHAAAATLVGARWGVAGLRTVIDDAGAPLARRYFAFLALAEWHPAAAWPMFERYLRAPSAHHAFLAVAVEAARFYPGRAPLLVELFERIRCDELLRRFLGPRLLESLYVLGDGAALPLFETLLVVGHTDADPERCEVTRALVAVRKLTGRLMPSAKFSDPIRAEADVFLDAAERRFDAQHHHLDPVTVI
jgi:hypothetical protein